MPDDQDWKMPLKKFMYYYAMKYCKNDSEKQKGCYDFIEKFFKQSDEQMQEAIQNATLLQLDAMLVCFESVNAEKNAAIDSSKLKICIDACYAIAKKHLVINDDSRSKDLLLCQMLGKHCLQKDLLKIKKQLQEKSLVMYRQSLGRQIQSLAIQAQVLEQQKQPLEQQKQPLEQQKQPLTMPKQALAPKEQIDELETKMSSLEDRMTKVNMRLLEIEKQTSETTEQTTKLKRQLLKLETNSAKLELQSTVLMKQSIKLQIQELKIRKLLLRYSQYAAVHEEVYENIISVVDANAEQISLEERLKMLQIIWDRETYTNVTIFAVEINKQARSIDSLIKLKNALKASFIDFLILINYEITLKNIFKYIDFLKPEYFEWHKLIDFVGFSLQCIDKPSLLPLGLRSEEVQKKITNFINKITVEHILLICSMLYSENKSNEDLKKFLRRDYPFKQLVLFWHNPKIDCVDNDCIPDAHIDYMRNMFLEAVLHRIKYGNTLESIFNLFITNADAVICLFEEVGCRKLLDIHDCAAYVPETTKMFDRCEENVRGRLGNAIVKRIERLKPEYILKLIHSGNYYDFAHHLSYETISKIFLMLEEPPEYIHGDCGEVFNMQDILSKNASDNFLFALCEGLKNNVLHDKSQELKDLILQKAKKSEIADLQFEVDSIEALQDAVGVGK